MTIKSKSGKPLLLRALRLDAVEAQREARFVAVGGVLVQNVLGNGLVDCRHGGVQKIARGSGIAGGDSSAQFSHHRADPRAGCGGYLVALKRCGPRLSKALVLLLIFVS